MPLQKTPLCDVVEFFSLQLKRQRKLPIRNSDRRFDAVSVDESPIGDPLAFRRAFICNVRQRTMDSVQDAR
jgi:hypothetical protein